jgi:hypothetical protein
MLGAPQSDVNPDSELVGRHGGATSMLEANKSQKK